MYGRNSELYQRMKRLDERGFGEFLIQAQEGFDFAEMSYGIMDMDLPLSKEKASVAKDLLKGEKDPDDDKYEVPTSYSGGGSSDLTIDLTDPVAESPDDDMARKAEGSLSIATGTAKNILWNGERHLNTAHTVPISKINLIDLRDLMNWVSQTSGANFRVCELGPTTAMVIKLGGEEQLASNAPKVENEIQPVKTLPEPVTGDGPVEDQPITVESSSFMQGVTTHPTSSGGM